MGEPLIAAKNEGNDDYFNGEWLRPISQMEKEMEETYRMGHRIWFQLNLSSAQPLQEDQVRRALTHLYRKTPCLNVTYGKKDGTLWMKRVTNPNVDFKAIYDKKVEDVRAELYEVNFNLETGPLFCARLLEAPTDDATDPEDIEPDFPQKYHLLFSIHHGVTDGTTCSYISNFTVSLLNDVLSSKPVDDGEMMGTFVSGEETMRLIGEKREFLETNPELEQRLATEYKLRTMETPITLKTFPTSDIKAKTDTLYNIFDRNTSSRFIQRCKQEKVTVNSAFTAIVNVAIVEVLKKQGLCQESYIIRNFHAVNIRKYWKNQPKFSLGCHMSYPLVAYSDTHKEAGNNLWQNARLVNRGLRQDIENGEMLLIDAYKLMLHDRHDSAEEEHKITSDYVTSNVCDVTGDVSEGGDHVRITNVVRSTNILPIDISLLFNYQTYRGRFMVFTDYNTAVLKKSTVEQIISQTIQCLHNSLTEPSHLEFK